MRHWSFWPVACLAASVVPVPCSRSPLQWLGRISYSWYLWHWPVLLLGVAYNSNHAPEYRALLVALSLALAAASHALVEAPLRRWQQWLAFPRTAVLASLAGMAAICLLGNHWTQQAQFVLHSPKLQRYASASADAPAIYRMGCDDWYRSADVRACRFGDANAEHTAVLIGDSHVGQWFPAVRKVLDKPGWQLLVLTKSSCPMVDVPFFYARIGRDYTECSQWRAEALRQIRRLALTSCCWAARPQTSPKNSGRKVPPASLPNSVRRRAASSCFKTPRTAVRWPRLLDEQSHASRLARPRHHLQRTSHLRARHQCPPMAHDRHCTLR